jgi:hypothetical protein
MFDELVRCFRTPNYTKHHVKTYVLALRQNTLVDDFTGFPRNTPPTKPLQIKMYLRSLNSGTEQLETVPPTLKL